MPPDGALMLGAGETAAGFADGSGSPFERGVGSSNSGPRPRFAVVGGG